MRYFLAICLLGLLAGPVGAQRPRWERTVDFPGTALLDLFGYMRPLPGGDYLVYGVGNNGLPGYPATVARYQPDGTPVFQRQGRRLATLEQDLLPLASGNLLLLGGVLDPTLQSSYPVNLFFQRQRPNGDTLPGVRHPGSVFQGIPAQMRPDGSDSVRVLLTGGRVGAAPAYFALATADTAGHLGPIRRYLSPTLNSAAACDLAPTARGGWLLAGEVVVVAANTAASHPYLVETDRLGRLLRQRVLTLFSATDDERVNRVWHNLIKLRDGSGYVLSGWQQADGGSSTQPRWGWLCKLDTALNVVWTYRHPPQARSYLLPTRVRELPDGTLGWLAGDGKVNGQSYTPYLYLLRVSAQGQLLGQRTFTSPGCSSLILYSWQPTADGYGAVVTGYAQNCTSTGSGAVAYTARLDSALALATAGPAAGSAGAGQLWPNPARETVSWQGPVPAGTAHAELLVVDALGRAVRRVGVAGRGGQVTQAVGLGGLAAGAYAVRLLVDGVPMGPVSRLLVEP